jgi:hypothetical protein
MAWGCYLSDVLWLQFYFTKENPDKKSFFFWFWSFRVFSSVLGLG